MGKMSRPRSWLLVFACASPLIALDPHQPLKQLHHTVWTARDGLTGEVHALAQTVDGFLRAGTRDGLFRFDGISFERYLPESGSLPARDVVTLFAVPSGGLWIGYYNGGATFLNAGRATNYAEDSGLPIGKVRAFAIDLDGTVWAALLTGLARFDGHRWQWIRTDWNFPVRIPFPDRFQGGRVSERDRLVENYSRKDGLSAGAVFCLLEDREGNVWVGTAAGLDRFRNRNLSWTELQSGGFGATLGEADHGDVWAFPEHPPAINLRDGKRLPGLPDWVVRARREPDGTIWMWAGMGRPRMAERESLWRWKAGQLVKVPMPYPTPVVAFATDSTGGVWVSIRGYGVFHQEHGEWKLMEILKGRSNMTAYSAIADAKGRVWLAYPELNTLALLDNGRVQTFSAADGLTIGAVGSFAEDGSVLWAGGELGLAYFRDGRFQTIESADPAGFGGISGIIPVPADGLWLNRPSGIVHIPQHELDLALQDAKHAINLESFDLVSDLPELPFLGPMASTVRSADGILWFATPRGVARIDPARIRRNSLAPPVAIRSVVADGKRYPVSQDTVLPPLTRNLRIGYSALSLSIPERVRARYKLEGSDKDWQDAGNLRDVFYTNLGPHKYTFRVIACNNDGVRNQTGASWNFEIEPAFYQTAWFNGLYVLAGATMIWLVYRFRLRQMTARVNLRYHERLAERSRIARELHDTLLQSFHGLMFRFQAARNMLPGRPEQTMEALDSALERTEEAMAEGRDAIHGLRASTVVTNELTQLVTALGKEMSHEPASQESAVGSARFHVAVEGTPREAVRNAFRHAQARNIEADITYNESSFQLRIRDDGQGIDPQIVAEGRAGHYGVSGMRERAKRIGGKLDVWSGNGAGTEVELSIPASSAYGTSLRRTILWRWRKKAGQTDD